MREEYEEYMQRKHEEHGERSENDMRQYIDYNKDRIIRDIISIFKTYNLLGQACWFWLEQGDVMFDLDEPKLKDYMLFEYDPKAERDSFVTLPMQVNDYLNDLYNL